MRVYSTTQSYHYILSALHKECQPTQTQSTQEETSQPVYDACAPTWLTFNLSSEELTLKPEPMGGQRKPKREM